jgi:hypothetical protein
MGACLLEVYDAMSCRTRAEKKSVERDGLRLQLVYDRNARQEVEHMVNRERDCCTFLTFDIHERETPSRSSLSGTPTTKASSLITWSFRRSVPKL